MPETEGPIGFDPGGEVTGIPRVDSKPTLKQLALKQARSQWDGEMVYIWGDEKRGAYLKASYNKGIVYLFITEHRFGCPIFVLLDGWVVNPHLDRDYAIWMRAARKSVSEHVPPSPPQDVDLLRRWAQSVRKK